MDTDTFLELLNLKRNGQYSSDKGNQLNGSNTRINRIAVIDQNYQQGGGFPYVTFEGESELSGKPYAVAGTYKPFAGDRVIMIPVGTTYMILDQIAESIATTIAPAGPRAYETPWIYANNPKVSNSPVFNGAWSNYETWAASFTDVRFKIDKKGKLRMQGLMYNATTATAGTLFTLPPGFRPDQRKRFNCSAGANGGHAEVTVDTNGVVSVLGYLYGGGANYLDLNKIRFFPASSAIPWTVLTTGQLSNAWTTPVNSDGQLRYYIDPDGIVHWEGSVGGGTVNSVVYASSAILPDDGLGHIFCQPCGNGAARVECGGASGTGIGVQALQTGGNSTYVSFDGVEYAGPTCNLHMRYIVGGIGSDFTNAWTNYSSGYGLCRTYQCSAGIQYMGGLVTGGTLASVVAQMPAGSRSRWQLIFQAFASANVSSRVDVAGSAANIGTVAPQGYGTAGTNTFLSLEDIRFPAEW